MTPGGKPRFGLAAKIVVPIVVLFGIFSAGLALWVSTATERSMRGQIAERNRYQYETVRHLLDLDWDLFASAIQDPVIASRLFPMVQRGMVDLLTTELSALSRRAGADIVQVWDAAGRFVASGEEVRSLTPPVFLEAFVAETLKEGAGTRFLTRIPREVCAYENIPLGSARAGLNTVLAVGATAVLEGDFGDPMGAIIAFRIVGGDSDTLADVARISGVNLSIIQDRTRVAAAVAAESGASETAELSALGGSLDPALPRALFWSDGGADYRTTVGPLKGRGDRTLGFLAVHTPVPSLSIVGSASGLRNSVIIAGLIVVIAFSALAFRIVREPVRVLNGILLFLGEVSRGRLEQTLSVKTRDEVGHLADAVNEMVVGLREIIRNVQTSFEVIDSVSRDLVAMANSLIAGKEKEEGAAECLDLASLELSSLVETVRSDVLKLKTASEDNLNALDGLAGYVGKVARNATELCDDAEKTNASVYELSASVTQVASNIASLSNLLHDNSAAMDQMDKSIQQVNSLTTETRAVTDSLAREAAEQGHRAMEEARREIHGVETVVTGLGDAVQRVNASAVNIGNIVGIISEIADRTKLVSLNAAILAAQAGEAGKGFSVVADSVGALSESTNRAVSDINAHVKEIQAEVGLAVEEAARGVSAVAQGATRVGTLVDVFEHIIQGAVRVQEMTERMADEASVQAQASTHVVSSLQQAAAMAEEVAKASSEQSDTVKYIAEIADMVNQRSRDVQQSTQEQWAAAREIKDQVEKTADVASELSLRAEAAERGVSTATEAVGLIREVVAESGRLASNLKEAVDRLDKQARNLKNRLRTFRLD